MRTWPSAKNWKDQVLQNQVQFSDKVLRAAIVMALYLQERPRPTFMDADIDVARQIFGVELWKET